MIRFGQMTEDELFVTADAAAGGVTIENLSDTEPLVILKHFGPGNPERPSPDAQAEDAGDSVQRCTAHTKPALHNAMWPGLVGKGPAPSRRSISTPCSTSPPTPKSNGARFDGVDLFLFDPARQHRFDR